MSIPTFDDFKNEVKRQFATMCPNLTKEQLDKYFYSDEAFEELNREYEKSSTRLKNGEITERVFMEGCTSSVCYCLYLMYE